MRPTVTALITTLIALSGTLVSAAPLPVPALTGRVNDTASVLTTEERQHLTQLLRGYETETAHQLAVLTVPSLAGEAIEDFSLRVVNTWKLGSKKYNDGILVTLAMQERSVRIEVGTGMERYISNAMAQAIVDEQMIPEFRQGHFAAGIEQGVMALMKAARRYKVPIRHLSPPTHQTTQVPAPGAPHGPMGRLES